MFPAGNRPVAPLPLMSRKPSPAKKPAAASSLPPPAPDSGLPGDDLLTIKETAAYLRIPLPTVYYLVQRGSLPAIQIGGRWRVRRSALDRDVLRKDRADGGQPSVLVVDDDPGLQEIFRQTLRRAGLSRVVVGTAREAATALAKQKFDLLFLDLQLPDEPGDVVFDKARSLQPDLPVVIITGYPESEVLNRILAHGPVTLLQKPLDTKQIARVIRLHGHRSVAGGPSRDGGNEA